MPLNRLVYSVHPIQSVHLTSPRCVSPAMPQSAADIYAKGLAHLGHGYPLWIPEPPDGKDALIGDVGYLLGGRFYRLFNVTKPRDHPLNSRGVPSKFEILDLERQPLHSINELFPPKAAICSHNVSATDITAGAEVSA